MVFLVHHEAVGFSGADEHPGGTCSTRQGRADQAPFDQRLAVQFRRVQQRQVHGLRHVAAGPHGPVHLFDHAKSLILYRTVNEGQRCQVAGQARAAADDQFRGFPLGIAPLRRLAYQVGIRVFHVFIHASRVAIPSRVPVRLCGPAISPPVRRLPDRPLFSVRA